MTTSMQLTFLDLGAYDTVQTVLYLLDVNDPGTSRGSHALRALREGQAISHEDLNVVQEMVACAADKDWVPCNHFEFLHILRSFEMLNTHRLEAAV